MFQIARKMKKGIDFKHVAIALIVLITGGLYWLSLPRPIQEPPTDETLIRFEAVREELVETVEVRGKSSYVNETDIYAPFSGKILQWNVKNGSQVKKGDILFEMDATELANDIALEEANLQLQEMNLKIQKLKEVTSVMDATEREKQKLEQEMERIRLRIANMELAKKREKWNQAAYRAPADGIFLFQQSQEPANVEENELLGKIVDLNQIQLVTTVGEHEVFQIREGLPVQVEIEALRGEKMEGTVERVSKFAKNDDESASTAQFEVIIALKPHERLIAGLNLTGKIVTARKENALTVPTLAVQWEDGKPFVYVEEGSSVTKRSVEIGLETAEKTEILRGLQEGETVVLQ